MPRRLATLLGQHDIFTEELPGDLQGAHRGERGEVFSSDSGSSILQSVEMVPIDPSADKEMRVSRQVRSAFYSFVLPEPMPNATLVALSSKVASEVLQVEVDDEQLPQILFATHLPSRARPWAHNYGGHQFGYYSGQLGDGRCISLGQIPIEGAADKAVCLQELQLKGCGKTPYSRFGDGHAILSSTIREFLACEYLAAIGIPTTRSLAVVGGSRAVYRENGVESGACLARVAPSFIRFGTFELFWYRGERHLVRQLADYVVKRHFPSLENSSKEIDNLYGDPIPQLLRHDSRMRVGSAYMLPTLELPDSSNVTEAPNEKGTAADDLKPNWKGILKPSLDANDTEVRQRRDTISVVTRPNLHVTEEHSLNGEIQGVIIEPFAPTRNVDIQLNKYARLFREVVRRTAILVAHWQAVGFVHGVLNTDNMSILGLTLDFGPFMFLDVYDPWACSNESDETGRYRFENQPKMVLWNLSKLGRTLVDLVVLDESNDLPMADGDGTPLDGKDVIRQLLESFEPIFVEKYTDLMRKKIGLRLSKDGDLENLILPLLWIMADAGVDYNGFFLRLCCFKSSDMAFDEELGPPVDPPTGVNLPESYIKLEQKRARASISVSSRGLFSRPPARRPSVFIDHLADGSEPVESSGCLDMLLKSAAALRLRAEVELEVYTQGADDARGHRIPSQDLRAAAVGIAIGMVAGDNSKSSLQSNRRSIRPDDGYLAIKPEYRRVSTLTVPSATVEADTTAKDTPQSPSSVPEQQQEEVQDEDDDYVDDDLFGPWLPSEQEIRYRWQRWARQYRSRLLIEQAASKSASQIAAEDNRRTERMRKVNPTFTLRGWILDEVVKSLSSKAELAPVDQDMEKIRRDLESILEATKLHQQGRSYHKDATDPNSTPITAQAEKDKDEEKVQPSEESSPKRDFTPFPEMDRCMQILVEDVWGKITRSHEWNNIEDADAALRWSGPPPKDKINVAQPRRS